MRLWKLKVTNPHVWDQIVEFRRTVNVAGPDTSDRKGDAYYTGRLFQLGFGTEYLNKSGEWRNNHDYLTFTVNRRWLWGENHGWYDGPHCAYYFGWFVVAHSRADHCKKCIDYDENMHTWHDALACDEELWKKQYKERYPDEKDED